MCYIIRSSSEDRTLQITEDKNGGLEDHCDHRCYGIHHGDRRRKRRVALCEPLNSGPHLWSKSIGGIVMSLYRLYGMFVAVVFYGVVLVGSAIASTKIPPSLVISWFALVAGIVCFARFAPSIFKARAFQTFMGIVAWSFPMIFMALVGFGLNVTLTGCSAGMVDSISDRARVVSVTYESTGIDGGPSGDLEGARNVPRDATITIVVHPRDCWVDWDIWTIRRYDGWVAEEEVGFHYSVDSNNFQRPKVILIPEGLMRADTTYKAIITAQPSNGGYQGNQDTKVLLFSTGEQIDFDLFQSPEAQRIESEVRSRLEKTRQQHLVPAS